VSHSLSPILQGRFFSQYGLDAVYVPFRVAAGVLGRAVDGLWAANVAGLNVTVPHKEAVLEKVRAARDARVIGAVNTLRHTAGGWRGFNTDWLGFRAVVRALKVRVRDAGVLMFGAGGTARAVLPALAAEGAGTVMICNRGAERRRLLIEHARKAYPGLSVEAVDWEQRAVDRACDSTSLLVNATSIGLGPKPASFPFHLRGPAAVDAVYTRSGDTLFVKAARDGGARAVDGLPLLVAQGAESFHLWERRHPDPLPVLRWLERWLDRPAAELPGWEKPA